MPDDWKGQIKTAVYRADATGEARVPREVALPGIAEEEARRYVKAWWDEREWTFERDVHGLTIRHRND